MLKSISLSNFKAIKDPFKFDIYPITLVTGPNNSGKSGLMKAMLLLKENLKGDSIPLNLDFSSEEHKLGDIYSTFSRYASSDNISFEIEFKSKIEGLPKFVDGGMLRISYNSQGQLFSLEMYCYDEGDLIELLRFEKRNENNTKHTTGYIGKLSLLNFLKIKIKENNIKSQKKKEDDFKKLLGQPIDEEIHLWNFKNPLRVNYSKLFNIENDIFDITLLNGAEAPSNYNKFEQELIELCDSEIFNSVFAGLIGFFEQLGDEGKTIPKKLSIKLSIENGISDLRGFGLVSELLAPDGEILCNGLMDISKIKAVNPEDVKSIYFSENGQYMLNLISIIIDSHLTLAGKSVNNISHLNPDKSSQNRAYFSNSGIVNKSLIFNYYNNNLAEAKISEKEKDSKKRKYDNYISVRKHFTDKWLRQLGIINENEYFYVKKYGEHTCEGIIGNAVTQKETNIADLGFGTGQLLMLLLKISESKENILLIEEPESNLHPDFQSKLADIIWDAYESFNTHFIIETHSEYLIRKMQFIIAKLNSATNKTANGITDKRAVIYYFNKTGLNKPASIDLIDITTDGRLTKDFGPGFLDESTKIIFDLWNLPGQN